MVSIEDLDIIGLITIAQAVVRFVTDNS